MTGSVRGDRRRGNGHRAGRADIRLPEESEVALMEITIQVDQMARRRHRRGMLLLLLAATLSCPRASLALSLLKAVLGTKPPSGRTPARSSSPASSHCC